MKKHHYENSYQRKLFKTVFSLKIQLDY